MELLYMIVVLVVPLSSPAVLIPPVLILEDPPDGRVLPLLVVLQEAMGPTILVVVR